MTQANPASPDPASPATDSSFADHVIAFGRVLRRLGFTVGPSHIALALEAIQRVGVHSKEDVYHALRTCLVQRREELDLFDQAFAIFWKAPSAIPEVMKWLLKTSQVPDAAANKGFNRIHEAIQEKKQRPPASSDTPSEKKVEIEEIVTYSPSELLRKKDFAAFTNQELAEARRHLARLRWSLPPYPTRRLTPAARGHRLDIRKTTRLGIHQGGEFIHLKRKGPRKKMRPIVMLCDISGSMERYARIMLHFMHSVIQHQHRVESFVFGTRLSRITHQLKHKEIDEALDGVSKHVVDWSGGTKIGDCIKTFNYTWLRRVLRSSSIVLIISDGWDRGDTRMLHAEMGRLSRSCYRLYWLNPLMGFEGYEPLTLGMQAALPYVDELLPIHNLHSIEQLVAAISSLT